MINVVEGPPPSRPLRLLITPFLVAAGLGVLVVYLNVTPGRSFDPYILTPSFIVDRLVRHVELVAIAFAVAAVAGIALGVVLAGRGRLARVLAFLPANLGQAVPSIGVLAIFRLITGIGVLTTVEALAFYGLLPVLRNTVVGLESADPAAVDAAWGMGMSRVQLLRQVQLPLATPVIFAGLRTSAVLIVGTATLGTFVAGGGIGDIIEAGYGYSDHIIIVGAVLVSALALLIDWGLGIAERLLSPKT